jgi:hypothetical protein
MSFLIHASEAIHEWDFHENARFTSIEADEFLRELYLYILQHKRPQWHAIPIYAVNHDSRTNGLLTVVHLHDDVYPTWQMKPKHENNHDGRFDSIQKLIRIHLMFKGSDGFEYRGTVMHFTDFHTLTSHYYININMLITRCSCWKECMEKIDSISENIDSIMDAINHQNRCLALIRYLSHESKRCNDPVHLRARQHKITALWRDIQNTPYPGPQVSEESATRDGAQTYRAEP